MTATISAETNIPGCQLAGKYLTFLLGDECYAIPALKVREIVRLSAITAVPHLPDSIRGVINLRGKIIPVMDLRVRFGLPSAANTGQTCIILVQVRTARSQSSAMGLVVDGVEEVVQLVESDIEQTPDFGSHIAIHYLLGMAKIKGKVQALLDIDEVVSREATAL
jgi:purine-binding chemotaxis protein CheW